jgi:hypothetical protein
MLTLSLRMNGAAHVQRRASGSGSRVALIAVIALFCAAGARADIIKLTVMNATFEATCVGGTGTCTEVVSGSGLLDTVAGSMSDFSFQLTGTLNASLVPGPPPSCVSPGCLDALYDSGVLPGYDPIEFGLVLNYPPLSSLLTTTPVSLVGLQPGNPTVLFVPALCGGDQPLCNTPGAFPGGPEADYALVSGTYTAVDEGPSPTPEPSSVILLVTGVAMVGFLPRRKRLWRRTAGDYRNFPL